MNLHPFLKDNAQGLKDQGSAAYDWLASQTFDHEDLKDRVFVNDHGLMDYRLPDGGSLFGTASPKAFYKDWLPAEKAATSLTFIVGSGLGYGINHVLANTPDTHKVVVLEPDKDMLLACLGQTDYRPFLEAGKLHFLPPDEHKVWESICRMDMQYVHGRIFVRADLPSRQMGPEYARWTGIVRDKMENFAVELSTLQKRQDVMVGNELANFDRALKDGSIKPLAGMGRGVTAVVVGSGPSLAAMGPKLAKASGNALYLAALQTLPVLQNLGLKPHLCVCIDFNKAMEVVFERLDPEFARDVPMIYSTKIHPDVLERYPGPTLPIWTLGGISTFTMRESEHVMDAGGNVGLTMARLLEFFGVDRVLLVGQDFGWSGEKTHAAGHHFADRGFTFNSKDHIRLENEDGDVVYSTPQFMSAKRDLEADILSMKTPVFNLYGGGVPIAGTRSVDLDQVRMQGLTSSVPGSMEAFLEALSRARREVPRPRFQAKGPAWANRLRAFEKRLEKLFKKPEKNQDAIHAELAQAERFMKSEGLYLPYLFNEALDMAGLVRARLRYEARDLGDFRKIVKRVMAKVREVDRRLCGSSDVKAA